MASMSRPVARQQSDQKGRIQHNPTHGCVSGSEELKGHSALFSFMAQMRCLFGGNQDHKM